MEHRVIHDNRIIMTFTINDEEIISVVDHWTEIYNNNTDDQSQLIRALGECAMSIGGREGAIAVIDTLKEASKSEVPLILIKKYINESGDSHREYIERQVLRLTEEITELRNTMNTREVDWGI